jgi:hypothetical protein
MTVYTALYDCASYAGRISRSAERHGAVISRAELLRAAVYATQVRHPGWTLSMRALTTRDIRVHPQTWTHDIRFTGCHVHVDLEMQWRHLRDVLAEHPLVVRHLSADELEYLALDCVDLETGEVARSLWTVLCQTLGRHPSSGEYRALDARVLAQLDDEGNARDPDDRPQTLADVGMSEADFLPAEYYLSEPRR